MSSTIKRISEELKEGKILVSDGAWGTRLIERGLKAGDCPEEWCVSHAQDVYEIGREYIEAGAHIIETNSFGANRFKLSHFGFQGRVVEFNEKSAALSRRAAGNKHHVMGSVGPTGKMLISGEISKEELFDAFSEQIRALERGGIDAVCIETMYALDEACIAVEAAKRNTDLEIICTFTFTKTVEGEYRTMMGVTPTQMAKALIEAGADIIGANCGIGSEQMIGIVKEIRGVAKNIPILVQANAGTPVYKNGVTVYPEGPEIMAHNVALLIEAGANIIGGCCGTTPKHIKAIARGVGEVYARR